MFIVDTEDPDWTVKQARSVALFVALKESSSVLLDGDKHREDVIKSLEAYASSDKVNTS